jgi:PEP-CTERM/exosortase A-associated glycosyltransferase
MRILHILDHSLPLHSGYSFRTIAILREQRSRGWETLQLTTPRQGGGAAEVEEADGWRFDRTPMRRTPFSALHGTILLQEMSATARRIGELAQSFRPDILHAHSPVLNALPALWVGRRRQIPVVYEVRALWEDAAVDHGTTTEGSPRYRASRALETFALRGADHVITICEGLRREITARGVEADRITVVPNAVDTSEFQLGTAPDVALRKRLGLDGKTVIGFAGSFYAYEGLDLLLEAATILTPRYPELRVLLVGGGPQEEALKAAAGQRGMGDRVIFAGRVPHDQVQKYYELVDVLAYPRRRMRLTEIVTPLKPLEAMALGRMFVASDVGGHRELVRHGENGFLFPADDARALAQAIEAVLSKRAEWPRLRAQARRFVETERTWAQSVALCAEVYGALCSPQGPTRAPSSRARV